MRKRIGNTIETPVREVPRFLEAEAFISSEQYPGLIARRIPPEDVDQLYPIEISLKVPACRLATPPAATILRE